jgi:hypothetical protein
VFPSPRILLSDFVSWVPFRTRTWCQGRCVSTLHEPGHSRPSGMSRHLLTHQILGHHILHRIPLLHALCLAALILPLLQQSNMFHGQQMKSITARAENGWYKKKWNSIKLRITGGHNPRLIVVDNDKDVGCHKPQHHTPPTRFIIFPKKHRGRGDKNDVTDTCVQRLV